MVCLHSSFIVGATAVMLATLLLVNAESAGECIKDNHRCLRNEECCSACCVEEKCAKFSDSCVKAQNPCSLESCPPGKVCYLQQVQCVAANCPPVPACKDEDYDYN